MTAQNKVITKLIFMALAWTCFTPTWAQERTDSLIINVGKSQIMFLIRDKADLDKLKQYDLNQILERLSLQLNGDSTLVSSAGVVSDTTIVVDSEISDPDDYDHNRHYSDDNRDQDRHDRDRNRYRKRSRRRHVFNVDLGINNYLEDGQFPGENNQLYAVRPWGSWYLGLVSVNQNYVGSNLYIEWGPSVSWYNFKFENDRTRIVDGDVVTFTEVTEPDTDFKKSKLTAAYLNFSVVPVLTFGERRSSGYVAGWKYKGSYSSDFRIGVGGYIGYRIASYSKTVVRVDGDKEKDRDKDSFNMNDLRYGLRAQLGLGGTDLFFTYDLNELFNEGQGPELNAFTIGIIL